MLSPDSLFDEVEVMGSESLVDVFSAGLNARTEKMFPAPVILPAPAPLMDPEPVALPAKHYAPAKETGWHKEKKATYRGGKEKKKMVGASEMTPAQRAVHYAKVQAAMADYIAKNGPPVCKRIQGDVRDGEITVNF